MIDSAPNQLKNTRDYLEANIYNEILCASKNGKTKISYKVTEIAKELVDEIIEKLIDNKYNVKIIGMEYNYWSIEIDWLKIE